MAEDQRIAVRQPEEAQRVLVEQLLRGAQGVGVAQLAVNAAGHLVATLYDPASGQTETQDAGALVFAELQDAVEQSAQAAASSALAAQGFAEQAAAAGNVRSVNGKSGPAVTLTAQDVGAAALGHAGATAACGAGTETLYGHVKLLDAVDSGSGVSSGTAATPAAVKRAVELCAPRVAATVSGDPLTLTLMADGIADVAVRGKTQQAGSGDPSPTNVRAITGVGAYDRLLMLNGTENWLTASSVGQYGFYFFGATGAKATSAVCTHFAYSTTQLVNIHADNANYVDKFSFGTGGNEPRFIISHTMLGTTPQSTVAECVNAAKAYFAAQYAAGTPVTIAYKSTAYATAAQFYTGISTTAEDGGYRGYILPLHKPLYAGDTVTASGTETHTKKRLVLDGTETTRAGRITGDYQCFYVDTLAGCAPVRYGDTSVLLCDQFPSAQAYGVEYEAISLTNTVSFWTFSVRTDRLAPYGWVSGSTDAALATQGGAMQAWLAAQYAAGTPVTIVYTLASPEVYAHETVRVENPAGALTLVAENTMDVTIAGAASTGYVDRRLRALEQRLAALEGTAG